MTRSLCSSTNQALAITVTAVNDNDPVFTSADAANFAVNATTGIVTFVASPNFESPTDVGADNVYDLTVTASDGTNSTNHANSP